MTATVRVMMAANYNVMGLMSKLSPRPVGLGETKSLSIILRRVSTEYREEPSARTNYYLSTRLDYAKPNLKLGG